MVELINECTSLNGHFANKGAPPTSVCLCLYVSRNKTMISIVFTTLYKREHIEIIRLSTLSLSLSFPKFIKILNSVGKKSSSIIYRSKEGRKEGRKKVQKGGINSMKKGDG